MQHDSSAEKVVQKVVTQYCQLREFELKSGVASSFIHNTISTDIRR